MIFQELAAAPDLTVAENVMLGQWPARYGLVNWRALRAAAGGILEELGVDLDLDAPVSSLRVAERQVIEIARALLGQARCLILDEPTAALSHQEVERLFAFIQRLRDRGVAIIYITHRLDEVHRVADRVQVLRDGASVLEGAVADFERDELVDGDGRQGGRRRQRPAPPARATEARPAALRGGRVRAPRSRTST